jgi:hypothetical protein
MPFAELQNACHEAHDFLVFIAAQSGGTNVRFDVFAEISRTFLLACDSAHFCDKSAHMSGCSAAHNFGKNQAQSLKHELDSNRETAH